MREEMTGKERVLCALNLGTPDRVPVFPVITRMHASRVMNRKILDFTLNPDLTYDALLAAWRLYGFDGFEVGEGQPKDWADDFVVVERGGELCWVSRTDGKLIARLQQDDDPVWEGEGFRIRSEADLEKMTVMTAEEYARSGRMDGIARVIEAVGEDACIAGHCSSQTMNSLVSLRGSDQALLDLYDNEDLVNAIMQRSTDITIEKARALVNAGVHCLYIGDAWCSSSIISPAHFRKFCVPQYKRYMESVRKLGVKVYLHICGNSSPILEAMADSGVDAIEPLDPLGGVDIGDAKARVGRRVCLKGGVNTLTLLNGTPDDVLNEARMCIEKAAPGGGFILGSGDDIPRDAPIANVQAMVRAAREYGRY